MTTSSTTVPRRYPGRLLLATGFGLAALGVAAYVVQMANDHLKAPWYMPVLATLGAGFAAAALWRACTVWRVLALVLLILFAGVQWAFLLGTRLTPYAGTRVAAGEPFPEFTTKRADGTPFTRRDLEGDRDTVMVFFRGRW